jgi:hypothetical protein
VPRSRAQVAHAVAAIVLTATLSLVAGRDLARQDAEFVDVPITDEHFDRGQYFLTVASSLVITSPLAQQMIEQIDGFPIRIVSHDPTPLIQRHQLPAQSWRLGGATCMCWRLEPGSGRNFRSIMLGDWIVARHHLTGLVAEGDPAIGVLGH